MEKLFTVDEVAMILRRKACSIRRKIKAGIIPAFRNGKAFLIPESGLTAYLEANRISSNAKIPTNRRTKKTSLTGEGGE